MDKVLSKDQSYGILERALYGVILGFAMKLVGWGWLSADMAPYVAAGGVGFVGSVYAWWHNRPTKLMDRAAEQLPRNNTLVITPTANASHTDKQEGKELADSAGPKVTAKV